MAKTETERTIDIISGISNFLIQNYLKQCKIIKQSPSRNEMLGLLQKEVKLLIAKRAASDNLKIKMLSGDRTFEYKVIPSYNTSHGNVFIEHYEIVSLVMMMEYNGKMKKFTIDKDGNISASRINNLLPHIKDFGLYISSVIKFINDMIVAALGESIKILSYNGVILVDGNMKEILYALIDDWMIDGKESIRPENHLKIANYLTNRMKLLIDKDIEECYIDLCLPQDGKDSNLPYAILESIEYKNSEVINFTIMPPSVQFEKPYAITHFTADQSKLVVVDTINYAMELINIVIKERLDYANAN